MSPLAAPPPTWSVVIVCVFHVVVEANEKLTEICPAVIGISPLMVKPWLVLLPAVVPEPVAAI